MLAALKVEKDNNSPIRIDDSLMGLKIAD